ncbi:MAG: rubredoxin [Chlorobi bacterium]|nr:rubredoxin [Chlorobiota bacterium]
MHECWQCRECGYVYDPAEGDTDNRIPAGTSFVQLPGTWCCPVCSEPKSSFDPM